MVMHAARTDRSLRLQRTLRLLEDGAEHSTLDIVARAQVCAVNSAISELRANGHAIDCRQGAGPDGGRVWYYRLAGREPSPGRPSGAASAAGSAELTRPARPVAAPGASPATAGGPGPCAFCRQEPATTTADDGEGNPAAACEDCARAVKADWFIDVEPGP